MLNLMQRANHAQIMRKSLRFVQSLILMACLFTFSACQKEEMVNPTSQPFSSQKSAGRTEETESSSISFNGEFLTFTNQKAFDETVKSLEQINNEASLLAWEQKNLPANFVSLRSIFVQAQKAQTEHLTTLVEKAKSDPKLLQNFRNQNPLNLQSDFAKKNISSLIFEEDARMRMNVFKSEFASLLNKEGIVSISGHILQFTDDYTKIMVGGDKSKINKLKLAVKDSKVDGIFVKEVSKRNLASGSVPNNGRTSFQGGGIETYETANEDNDYTDYKIAWGVYLDTYAIPIYDYNDQTYQACLYEQAYTSNPNIICTAPVIGWTYRSNYYQNARGESVILWTIVQTFPVSINVNYSYVLNGSYSGGLGQSGGGYSKTLYSGAMVNVTDAMHIFTFGNLHMDSNGFTPSPITAPAVTF